eukprot:392675-Rhodomonas_salina.2
MGAGRAGCGVRLPRRASSLCTPCPFSSSRLPHASSLLPPPCVLSHRRSSSPPLQCSIQRKQHVAVLLTMSLMSLVSRVLCYECR